MTCQTASHFTSSGIVTTGPSNLTDRLYQPPHPHCGSHTESQNCSNEVQNLTNTWRKLFYLTFVDNHWMIHQSPNSITPHLCFLYRRPAWKYCMKILTRHTLSLTMRWGQEYTPLPNITPDVHTGYSKHFTTSTFITTMEENSDRPRRRKLPWSLSSWVQEGILNLFQQATTNLTIFGSGGWWIKMEKKFKKPPSNVPTFISIKTVNFFPKYSFNQNGFFPHYLGHFAGVKNQA